MSDKKKKKNEVTEDTEKDLPQTEETTSETEEKGEEKSETENKKAKDQFVRLAADFDNYKKRTEAEKAALRGMVVSDTVQMMLPILDNLERAVSAAAVEDSPLKDGVVMVLNQAKTAFENFGVTSFGERGDKFDPTIHNAVMTCRDDELEPDTVATVLQKGYKINDRIIRHALVQVVSE